VAEAWIKAFDGRAVAPVAGPDLVKITGSSGAPDTPHGLTIGVLGKRRLTVETTLGAGYRGSVSHQLFHLLFGAVTENRRPRVPLDIRIDRDRQRLLLDGRPRVFTVYACGRWAMATAEIRGNHVQLLATAEKMARIELHTLDARALEPLVEEWAARHLKAPAGRRRQTR
jgi:hypothetical protein